LFQAGKWPAQLYIFELITRRSEVQILPAQLSDCAELARTWHSAFFVLGPFLGHAALDRRFHRILQWIAPGLQETTDLAWTKEQGRGQAH